MMERRCAVPGPRGCGVMRRPCQCVHPLSCRLRLLSNSDSRWEGLHGGRGTKLPVRLSDTQRAESPPDRPVANAGSRSRRVPVCRVVRSWSPGPGPTRSCAQSPDSRFVPRNWPGAPGPARAGRGGSDWAIGCIINWQALAGTQNREPAPGRRWPRPRRLGELHHAAAGFDDGPL